MPVLLYSKGKIYNLLSLSLSIIGPFIILSLFFIFTVIIAFLILLFKYGWLIEIETIFSYIDKQHEDLFEIIIESYSE